MKKLSVILFVLLFFAAGCGNEGFEARGESVTNVQNEREAIPYVKLAVQQYINRKEFHIPMSSVVVKPYPDYNTEAGFGGTVYEKIDDRLATIINYHVTFDGAVTLWHEELDNTYDFVVSFYDRSN